MCFSETQNASFTATVLNVLTFSCQQNIFLFFHSQICCRVCPKSSSKWEWYSPKTSNDERISPFALQLFLHRYWDTRPHSVKQFYFLTSKPFISLIQNTDLPQEILREKSVSTVMLLGSERNKSAKWTLSKTWYRPDFLNFFSYFFLSSHMKP